MVVVSQPGRCDGLMPVSKLVHMRGGESVDLSLDVSLRSVGFVDFDGTFDNHGRWSVAGSVRRWGSGGTSVPMALRLRLRLVRVGCRTKASLIACDMAPQLVTDSSGTMR